MVLLTNFNFLAFKFNQKILANFFVKFSIGKQIFHTDNTQLKWMIFRVSDIRVDKM